MLSLAFVFLIAPWLAYFAGSLRAFEPSIKCPSVAQKWPLVN